MGASAASRPKVWAGSVCWDMGEWEGGKIMGVCADLDGGHRQHRRVGSVRRQRQPAAGRQQGGSFSEPGREAASLSQPVCGFSEPACVRLLRGRRRFRSAGAGRGALSSIEGCKEGPCGNCAGGGGTTARRVAVGRVISRRVGRAKGAKHAGGALHVVIARADVGCEGQTRRSESMHAPLCLIHYTLHSQPRTCGGGQRCGQHQQVPAAGHCAAAVTASIIAYGPIYANV